MCFVEYAKSGPEDIGAGDGHQPGTRPGRTASPADTVVSQRLVEVDRRIEPGRTEAHVEAVQASTASSVVAGSHSLLGEFTCSAKAKRTLLFTENETNHERLFPGQKNESPSSKMAIHDCVVHGQQNAVNPRKTGHEGRGSLPRDLGAGQTQVISPAALEREAEPE